MRHGGAPPSRRTTLFGAVQWSVSWLKIARDQGIAVHCARLAGRTTQAFTSSAQNSFCGQNKAIEGGVAGGGSVARDTGYCPAVHHHASDPWGILNIAPAVHTW